MPWYLYLASFFAGVFLANALPHLVYGIAGDRFPTPFAKPPGKGLSSPTVNVLWSLANLVVTYALFSVGLVIAGGLLVHAVAFAGFAAWGTLLSREAAKKHVD